MEKNELDTIIKLIPLTTVREIEIIIGQMDIHLKLLEKKQHKLVEKDKFDFSFSSIFEK